MMVINNNIPALTTYGIVNNTSNALEKSIQKLSTGLRINSAADDAAGLSISEKMRAQINGLDRAVANAQDGVSLIQTAEGALTETHSILQRMRELSVQAANDTFTAQDRSYIQEEVDLLREEIDHIGNTTTFNTKKLLNGDAAVLWSSDDLNTKALVRGGLRTIDQFGQKTSAEGNYKITIESTPGEAEIQKTDIFKVKHPNVGTSEVADFYKENGRIDSVSAEGLQAGVAHKVKVAAPSNTAATVTGGVSLTNVGYYQAGKAATNTLLSGNGLLKQASSGGNGYNYSLAFEVTNVVDGSTGANAASIETEVTFKITGFQTDKDGNVKEINTTQTIKSQVNGVVNTVYGIPQADSTNVRFATGLSEADLAKFNVGDKLVLNFTESKATATNAIKFQVDTDVDASATTAASASFTTTAYTAIYNNNLLDNNNSDVTLAFMNIDTDSGEISKSKITLKTGNNADHKAFNANSNPPAGSLSSDDKEVGLKETSGDIAVIKNYEIGDVADGSVKLRDLDKFWDSQGNFLLEDPQTITITQGDGKTAKVTLYAYDTLDSMAKKFNDAIANDLGQAEYVDNKDMFVEYVDQPLENTMKSVKGTMVINSAVAGKDGTLRFSSNNEDLINALSLNTLQSSKESTYKVTVKDAHTGETKVDGEEITGNVLVGKLHENVDIEFDAMTGIKATYNKATGKFDLAKGTGDTILHLADNTTTFQIGANKGDDMGINIGDMRSHALGLDKVLVTDHKSASDSISIIDNAIDRVSTQRAKLGAYQNRLEHTMTNLQTSSENLSSAESRIRDTDMAKEMMNFTKLNIMLQAGNSMLAQANQLPNNVLSLIR